MLTHIELEKMDEAQLTKKYDAILAEMEVASTNLQALPIGGGSPAEKLQADVLLAGLADSQALANKIHTRLRSFELQAAQREEQKVQDGIRRDNAQWKAQIQATQQAQYEKARAAFLAK